jgi:hypothetical protein
VEIAIVGFSSTESLGIDHSRILRVPSSCLHTFRNNRRNRRPRVTSHFWRAEHRKVPGFVAHGAMVSPWRDETRHLTVLGSPNQQSRHHTIANSVDSSRRAQF